LARDVHFSSIANDNPRQEQAMNAIPTSNVAAALATIRGGSITVEQLAHHFDQNEAFAAGLIDIVTGDQDWRYSFDANDVVPSKQEQDDYARGAMLAERLLAEEANADGWQEAQALAEFEAMLAAAPQPVYGDDDIPF
jgi:hypothetical protein